MKRHRTVPITNVVKIMLIIMGTYILKNLMFLMALLMQCKEERDNRMINKKVMGWIIGILVIGLIMWGVFLVVKQFIGIYTGMAYAKEIVLEQAMEDLGANCNIVRSYYVGEEKRYYIGCVNEDKTSAIMYTVYRMSNKQNWAALQKGRKDGPNAMELFIGRGQKAWR